MGNDVLANQKAIQTLTRVIIKNQHVTEEVVQNIQQLTRLLSDMLARNGSHSHSVCQFNEQK